MIANELEYRTAKAALRRLEEGQAHAHDHETEREPSLQQVMHEAIEGEVDSLRAQLQEYEALRSGQIREISFSSLGAVPDLLIAARIAAQWSQEDLAQRLGLAHQQIQRYEATRYQTASFARLLEIAAALRVDLSGHVQFCSPSSIGLR